MPFLSRRLNPATGIIEGRFALHPEPASKVFAAIDRHVTTAIAAGEARGDTEFLERRIDRNRLAAEALGDLVGTIPWEQGGETDLSNLTNSESDPRRAPLKNLCS